MKKIDNSRIEYAALTINTDISPLSEGTIENRSIADEVGDAMVNDNELKFIKAHWQKNIIKHQPPIVQSPSELSKQCGGLKAAG